MIQPDTLGSLYRNFSRELIAAKFDEPYIEARILLAHAAHINPARIFGHPEDPVDSNIIKNAYKILKRRKRGEPVAYITGTQEFWSIDFQVTPDTLIPRPESETIIETVLGSISDKKHSLRILDLGTGSGCLLLSLLSELPNATGIGVDILPKACRVAQHNSLKLNLEKRAEFRQGDWINNIDEQFDIIVSNPPYIRDSEIRLLNESIKNFEPYIALSGGHDGLVSYRDIINHSRGHLKPDGVIILEIGINQATDISHIFASFEFNIEKIAKDLSNIDRCILATLIKS